MLIIVLAKEKRIKSIHIIESIINFINKINNINTNEQRISEKDLNEREKELREELGSSFKIELLDINGNYNCINCRNCIYCTDCIRMRILQIL